MLEDLTVEQYDGWLAWLKKYQVYPNREDIHWGRLISIVYNQWAQDPIDIYDATPYLDRFEEDLTAEELARRLGL